MLTIVLSLIACDTRSPDVLQTPRTPSSTECTAVPGEPELLFDEVWSALEATYPFFDHKGIDWNALHETCRQKVCMARHTYEDFVGPAASCLLAPLADHRISLAGQAHGIDVPDKNIDPYLTFFHLDKGPVRLTTNNALVATIGEGRIVYVRFEMLGAFGVDWSLLQRLETEYWSHAAWVLDLRELFAGSDLEEPMTYAGRLVNDTSSPYAYVQFRDEVDGDPATYELGPQVGLTLDPVYVADQFSGKVALLTGPACSKACEDFVALTTLSPNVRRFGEATLGSSGQVDLVVLSDGTRLYAPTALVTLADRVTVIEGNGIAPDEPVEFLGGDEDQVLAAAIAWLEAGLED